MGTLSDMEKSWANTLKPSPQVAAWIDAVSQAVDSLVVGNGVVFRTLGDADQHLVVGTNLTDGVLNVYQMTPTAARIVTIDPVATAGTRIVILNKSAAFPIDARYNTAGPLDQTVQSYAGPEKQYSVIWTGSQWDIQNPQVQSGSIQMSNTGTTAAIPADINNSSRIVTGIKTVGGTMIFACAALSANRNNGTRQGGGSFKLSSITSDGQTGSTDSTIYDWHIVGG